MYYVLERKDILTMCPYLFNNKQDVLDFVKNNLSQSRYILKKLDNWLNKTNCNDCKNFSSFAIYSKTN